MIDLLFSLNRLDLLLGSFLTITFDLFAELADFSTLLALYLLKLLLLILV